MQVQCSRNFAREELADAGSVERGVRQLLADKISGSYLGLWLLIPEHLRLGTWDLLRGWTRQPPNASSHAWLFSWCMNPLSASPAFQHNVRCLRRDLPWPAACRSLPPTPPCTTCWRPAPSPIRRTCKVALGQLRRASGHYEGHILVIDPHRLRSYSKRQMRLHRKEPTADAMKITQTFFALDGDTGQPVCFTTGTASRTVAQATPELLDLADTILGPRSDKTLVLADAEHFSREVFADVRRRPGFDLLAPLIVRKLYLEELRRLPSDCFTPHWAGYATAGCLTHSSKMQNPCLSSCSLWGSTCRLQIQRFPLFQSKG